jgi:hypothetical protein
MTIVRLAGIPILSWPGTRVEFSRDNEISVLLAWTSETSDAAATK